MDSGTVVTQWVDENRAAIEKCVQRAIEALEGDTPLRVPRTEAERRHGFAEWLARYRARLGPLIQAELQSQCPSLPAQLKQPDACEAVVRDVLWPEVERFLKRYAARGLAAEWVSHHMGDATTMAWPEPLDDGWLVRLGVAGHGENLGQLVLDADGRVIPHRTTSRQEILEAISGGSRPRAEAATRQ
jgi:hypothetical protein